MSLSSFFFFRTPSPSRICRARGLDERRENKSWANFAGSTLPRGGDGHRGGAPQSSHPKLGDLESDSKASAMRGAAGQGCPTTRKQTCAPHSDPSLRLQPRSLGSNGGGGRAASRSGSLGGSGGREAVGEVCAARGNGRAESRVSRAAGARLPPRASHPPDGTARRALPATAVSRSVGSSDVTACAAPDWASRADHVTERGAIKRARGTAVVRHFVDAAGPCASVGAEPEGSGSGLSEREDLSVGLLNPGSR